MHAMILPAPGQPLVPTTSDTRVVGPGQVRITVLACGVCRTDLHVVDGELPKPRLPIIPGHEIVGRIVELGGGVEGHSVGDRVGVPWLGWACGRCEYCQRGEENLCPYARFTGYDLDGGYASEVVADARFVFPLPDNYSDEEAAPLMCAGLIGWRCLKMAGKAPKLGLYGFGAAAHIIIQVARARGDRVFAFVKPGDETAKAFASSMGAEWAGASDQPGPEPLDAAILFAPAGELVPAALRAVRPGGTVVCGGIHMSDIPSFPYDLLWRERSIKSVANLTRADGEEFLAFCAKQKIHTTTVRYPLAAANQALSDLRDGRLTGAAVLVPNQS